MPDNEDDEPSFTVPEFAREDQQQAEDAHRPDGRYIRGLSFRISELLIKGRKADYDMGALVDEVMVNHFWRRWTGDVSFTRFEEWSWAVLGCRERKAIYLRDNWKALSSMNLSEFALTCAIRLGWSKLKEILRIARNEVQLLEWCERAARDPQTGKPMTEKALRMAVVAAGAETRERRGPRDGGMDDEAEPEERGHRVSCKVVFRDVESYASVMQVVEIIKRRFNPEMGDGEALALMATNYLSAYPSDSDGGASVELDMVLKRIEAHYRLKLVPVEFGPGTAPGSSNDVAVSI